MSGFDRAGIAERLRSLIGTRDGKELAGIAARLGLEEVSLRMSIDHDSPHPTVEVLAAVIRVYGVDPSWLMTGTYDAVTHRGALEGTTSLAQALRDFMMPKTIRISAPTDETFQRHAHN